ncbi:UbiA family prenyltransferase [uncultured Ramlibacter sp.]|uniref:UbiA family prenyltransferase n=1 Tax=uncultured Ramlibacter sp. TaxID=260755 RepID=UPI0026379257|nr:UbiA family prenyltransferase [uncultured Ramlibacter sp.]
MFAELPLQPPQEAPAVPLVVDLDGTLLKTDLLAETASAFVLRSPWRAWQLLAWLAQGRSHLKAQLAQQAPPEVATLPYNEELLVWLRDQKQRGRRIILATGSHRLLAERVASHLQLFDQVLATEGAANLKAEAKRDALVDLYGKGGFDYVGNDRADLPVWQSAAQAHVVCRLSQPPACIAVADNLGRTIGTAAPHAAAALLQAMRPHQWLKNLLLLLPLFTAHAYGNPVSVLQALLAFLAFSLAASGVYLLNDLSDIAADRHHPSKRMRPFAAGSLAIVHGWVAWPSLLAAALALCWLLPPSFGLALGVYVALTTAYSLRLKQIPVLDVLTLASLYTLRVVAGAAAIGVPLSFWLLAFSMFMFVSLAFMKRYSELEAIRSTSEPQALRGRGYKPTDFELVASLGSTAGQVAILVLALYIQDATTAALYAEPRFIWLACPLLLYWVSRAWLITHRGQMHDDPVIFALKDRPSWAILGLVALAFILARTGL